MSAPGAVTAAWCWRAVRVRPVFTVTPRVRLISLAFLCYSSSHSCSGAFSAAGTSPFTTGEVRALTQDDSGNLWAGLNTASTLDSYLWKFDGATWTGECRCLCGAW